MKQVAVYCPHRFVGALDDPRLQLEGITNVVMLGNAMLGGDQNAALKAAMALTSIGIKVDIALIDEVDSFEYIDLCEKCKEALGHKE